MDLQYALLLIGFIVVAAIVFSAFDRARVERRFRRDESDHAEASAADRAREDSTDATNGPLDINPPPLATTKRKLLSVGNWIRNARPALKAAPKPARVPPSLGEGFQRQLKSLEEIALMPLDLGAGYQRPRSGRNAPMQPAAPDEKVDFVVQFAGTDAVSRNAALGIYKQHEFDLEKPHRLYGKGRKARFWSELQYDPEQAKYDDLKLSVQMADAKGSITESELHIFTQLGLKLADGLQRTPKFRVPVELAIERGKALHEFCEEYDVIAAVNVISSEGRVFKGRAIERAARKLGMQFGAMNIFHVKNDASPGCRHLFSMANSVKPGDFDPNAWADVRTTGLSLFMSVPCAHHPPEVFDKMVETAVNLCHELEGHLQDQERRALTKPGIDVIREQIQSIEEKMEAFGIAPGSETALRLFGNALTA